MHVCKYTNTQESRSERLKLCKFLRMWLCNQTSMPPYEYVIVSNCHTRVQLENFRSAWNLAIFTVIEVSTLQVWNYGNIHVWEDKSIKVCRAGMQMFKCVGMPLGMYESIQIHKKVGMKD